MENPGFKMLRDAFNAFASKYSGEDLAARALRSVAAGAKATVDRGLVEFPKDFITDLSKDIYNMISSQEVADGVSSIVRSYDEEKVKDMVDGLVSKLKEPETALKVAKSIKDALDKTTADDLEMMLDGVTGNLPMNQQMLLRMFFGQIKPMITQMKGESVEDIAERIVALADNIPSDMIAAQVASLTREVTPERISKQTLEIVGQLPSPGAVADIVHGVGNLASQQLDKLSQIATPQDASGILSDFTAAASDMVSEKIAKDTAAKKTFKPKQGDDFEF